MAKLRDPRLDQIAKTVNEDILDRSIRHSVYLERYKAGQVRSVVGFFNGDVVPDLLGQVEKLNAGTLTGKRMRELTTACDKLCQTGYREMHGYFEEDLRGLALTEAEWQRAALKAVVPIDIDFRTPSPAMLNTLVSKSVVRGKFVKDWFDELGTQTAARVAQQVRIGIAEGESIDKIVRRLRGTKVLNYTDGVVQESRRNLETIVRTSVSGISNDTRDAVYTANNDVVKGVQFIATLDTRTTEICMSLDGKVYNIGDGPRPPMHHNCRSTTVPILKSWKELGIDLKEASPATRASMNGQVPDKLTYGKWLKKQPVHIQDEALGKTKAKLFRTGKVKIDKFVGQNNKPLSLEQLRKIEGLSYDNIKIKRLGITRSGDIKGTVRQWADKYIDAGNLSKAQAKAILEYQQGAFSKVHGNVGGYYGIQDYLRFGRIEKGWVPPRKKSAIKNVVANIDSAMRTSTLKSKVNLYRGVSNYPVSMQLKNIKSLKPGYVFSDKGFVSTTPRLAKANKYALAGNDSAMFRIRGKKGQNAFYVNIVGEMHEQEFLLPRKSKFRVVDVIAYKAGGRRMPLITLEIVD